MRLLVARALAARSLLTAAIVVALAATTLITALLLLARLQPEAGVRAALTEGAAHERTILLTAAAGDSVEVVAERDAAVRELLADGLGEVALPVSRAARGQGHRLPATAQDTLVMSLPRIGEHAELVAGSWPVPRHGGGDVEVVVPRAVADTRGWHVGDRIELQDWIRGEDHDVRIVGTWEAHDPEAAYWELTAGWIDEAAPGPLVVAEQEFLATFRAGATVRWLAEPDPRELAAAGMEEVAASVDALHQRMLERRDAEGVWAPSTRMQRDLAGRARDLHLASVVQRSGLVLPAALLAVIAAYTLVLLARLLATHRRGETALLRARGASRWQLVAVSAAEGLLVAAPAAAVSAPLAAWLVAWADATGTGGVGVADDLAVVGPWGPPFAWLVALVAASGCAAALALPAARQERSWRAAQQLRARPRRSTIAGRAGLDLGLIAVAGVAWLQLRRYGGGVAPRDLGGIGVDPVLTLAPVVAVLAATVVALRVLPLATRQAVRLAAWRDRFPELLGAWQADRRPHAGPVLLLVLAVATAVLAPSVAATWERSQRDQAAHVVGADVRLAGPEGDVRRAADELVPQGSAQMYVVRSGAVVGDAGRAPLLALDSAAAAEVVQLRDDLAEDATLDLAALGEGRPEPRGIALPEGTRTLGLQVAITADRASIEPRIPSLVFADAEGHLRTVSLPLPERGGSAVVEVTVPEGAVELVAVRGALRFDPPRVLPDDVPPPTFDVVWQLTDLVAHSASGAQALDVPSGWELDLGPDWRPGPQRIAPTLDAPGEVHLEVDPASHPTQRVEFLLAEAVEIPSVPAILTPEAVEALGGGELLGDVVEVGPTTLRIAGVLPALPGTDDAVAIAVDLAWLAHQQAYRFADVPAPDELWIATETPETAAQIGQAHGLQVHDRTSEAERRLADPQGASVLQTLWVAAAAAVALAAFGLLVDARAMAVQRRRELAFLHVLGAPPRALARSLVVEQAALAVLGLVAGVVVGLAVATTMGASLVLTRTGEVPVPAPIVALEPGPFLVPAVGLLLTSVVLGALVARRARREVDDGALRIGEDA